MIQYFIRRWMCLQMIAFCLAASLQADTDEFMFNPPENFTLTPTYIALHHPVTSSNVTAQLYFDQGLTLIYAFNHDAAYWSFLRASQADPSMPMAYWGMALAIGSNINDKITPYRSQLAFDLIQKALQLAPNVPQSEQDYIQALAKRYSNQPQVDTNQLSIQYSQAMRELAHRYPDDPDASVLFAESLLDLNPWNQWTKEGKPREGTLEAVEALESVLKKNPDHLGANHYYIHAVEASSYPERALVSAERLRHALPASGHLIHMPSHIFSLVGDYHEAARSNEEAAAIDRSFIRQYGIHGIYPVHYLSHNLYFLAFAYFMEGRLQDAKQAAFEDAELYLPHFKRMPGMEFYLSAPLSILLSFHRWQEVLALPKPADEMKLTTTFWHYGRAMAFAGLGQIEQAMQERRLFLDAKANLAPDQQFGNNKASTVMTIAALTLEAKLAEQQGQQQRAIDLLQQAINEQDNLGYDEPPHWLYSIRGALGGLLMRAGRYAEAERIFREELNKHTRSGRALFGLRESLIAQRKFYDAYWVNKNFQQAWQYSQINLTVEDL